MTTTKSARKRKFSTRAQPKRATASATRAVPAVNPAVPTVCPAEVPTVRAALHVQLEPGLEIKDAEGVHRLLSAALVEQRAIAVDVGRVQAVDTAGAQLLLAFQSEASRRGVTIEFRGESPPLIHALAVLGLRDKFSLAIPHG